MKIVVRKARKKIKVVKANAQGLEVAVAILRAGGVVAFPTETSYGLAADATNARAVAKVYKVKKRMREKSLPIIVASLKMAEKYAVLTPLARKLAARFFPAPLTLVVGIRQNSALAKPLSSNGKVAFRVPVYSFARNLARKLGRPVTATSANISGNSPVFSPHKLANLKVDLIVDGGKLPKRKPSTIVDCIGKPLVLRQGDVSIGKV